MVTLSQAIGFPALLLFLYITAPFVIDHSTLESKHNSKQRPSTILILALLHKFLGVFPSMLCLMYSIGLLYLPVSTYSLICASQLGFNAVSSFFLNAQKFTPYITNSVFVLIISSVLLVFQNDSVESTDTIIASAGYALMLSITQLSYRRILKEETIRVVLALAIYQSMIVSFVIIVGFFVSGEWRSLRSDIDGFELGKPLYVTVLFSKAVSWQVYAKRLNVDTRPNQLLSLLFWVVDDGCIAM